MNPDDNRRSGGGEVIAFPAKTASGSPFDRLTVQVILAQHRNGTLQEGVLLALLAGVGLQP
jgi:hypothetical protein